MKLNYAYTYMYIFNSFIHTFIHIYTYHQEKNWYHTMPWRTEILQCPSSRKHMYRPVWSLPMIERRTGWKFCGQMRPKSSTLASTKLTVLGGGGMLSMTPRTPSPLSNMEVETLCFGGVSAKGTGQLPRIKGTMDGAMYRQGQGIENWSWMGIPAWQWPKTHGQGNKGEAQEEAH